MLLRVVLWVFVFAAAHPSLCAAQDAALPKADILFWLKAATLLLGTPATLMGAVVSWNMITKTRLESRKLLLEIAEKERALSGSDASTAEKIELLTTPVTDNQRALLILVRFVLLELTLRIWTFVPDSLIALVGLITGGFIWLFSPEHIGPMIIAGIVSPIVRLLTSIVYWLIVFGFGWPLFKDTCDFLNIPIKNLFDIPWIARYRVSKRGG